MRGSEVSPCGFLQDHLVQGQIRHGAAQTGVFGFEFLEAFDLNGRETAKLLPPSTNNRAERALRFGVLWRKGSLGTASVKGNDWVQRSLSLRQTCRQLEQSTFSVLVDALEAFMHDRPPDLSWLR